MPGPSEYKEGRLGLPKVLMNVIIDYATTFDSSEYAHYDLESSLVFTCGEHGTTRSLFPDIVIDDYNLRNGWHDLN